MKNWKKIRYHNIESFAEKPHDDNVAPSVEDKLVLNSYKKICKKRGGSI